MSPFTQLQLSSIWKSLQFYFYFYFILFPIYTITTKLHLNCTLRKFRVTSSVSVKWSNSIPLEFVWVLWVNNRIVLCSVVPLFLTIWDPIEGSLPGLLCSWNFPGKNAGVGCHVLVQGIFLTHGWMEAASLEPPALAGKFFTTVLPGKPSDKISTMLIYEQKIITVAATFPSCLKL